MNQSATVNVPYLDGWRGLAIISVLIGHFGTFPALSSWMGQFGVQLFFALSGYLMAHLLFTKKVGMPDFFARRITRVAPTFFLYVACMYVLARTAGPAPYAVPAEELAATLFFARTYWPAHTSIFAGDWIIGHLWSLNVEEHSYVFLALGAVLTRQARTPWAACVFLLASTAAIVAFCLAYSAAPPAGASPWFLRSECAALGLVAAAAIRVLRSSAPPSWLGSVPPLLPVLWLTIAIAAMSTYKHNGGQYIVAPLCLALAVNFLDCVPVMLRQLLSAAPLRWFGKCSFSLYLWQQPFFVAVIEADMSPLTGCVLGIAAGALCFYAFENPLRIRLNRAWAARSLAPPRSLQT